MEAHVTLPLETLQWCPCTQSKNQSVRTYETSPHPTSLTWSSPSPPSQFTLLQSQVPLPSGSSNPPGVLLPWGLCTHSSVCLQCASIGIYKTHPLFSFRALLTYPLLYFLLSINRYIIYNMFCLYVAPIRMSATGRKEFLSVSFTVIYSLLRIVPGIQ